MAGDTSLHSKGEYQGKEIDLKQLAQWDFRLDWAVIAALVLIPSWIPLFLMGLWLSTMFFILVTLAIASWGWACWCTHRIMVELKTRLLLRVSFWMMAAFLPGAMIFMGVVALRAGRVLSQNGIHVGFFGITRRKLRELSPGMCRHCGYDVRGSKDGVCPECGIAVCNQCGYDVRGLRRGTCPECGHAIITG